MESVTQSCTNLSLDGLKQHYDRAVNPSNTADRDALMYIMMMRASRKLRKLRPGADIYAGVVSYNKAALILFYRYTDSWYCLIIPQLPTTIRSHMFGDSGAAVHDFLSRELNSGGRLLWGRCICPACPAVNDAVLVLL